MATYRLDGTSLHGGEKTAEWQASHVYSLGTRCVCTTAYGTASARAYVYECTTAGTSGGSQPSWPTTVGNTVSDGGVTWTCRSPADGSWDNASCYIIYITAHAANPAIANTVLVEKTHSETYTVLTNAGIIGGTTFSLPLRILCVDKENSDALSVGAVAGFNCMTLLFEGYGYSYGVKFRQDSSYGIRIGASSKTYWILQCDGSSFDVLDMNHASTSLYSDLSTAYPAQLDIKNGCVRFGYAANTIRTNSQKRFIFRWDGGALHAPNGVTYLFGAYHDSLVNDASFIKNVDLSEIGAGSLSYVSAYYYAGIPLISNCKLPSDTGFSLWGNAISNTYCSENIKLHSCSTGNSIHGLKEEGLLGVVVDDGNVYRTDGANDGAGFSLKMTGTDTVSKNMPLESLAIRGWTDSTSEKTFTVEGIANGAVYDDEIWMELKGPKDNTTCLNQMVSTQKMPQGTPAQLASSSSGWSGTPGGYARFDASMVKTLGSSGSIAAKCNIRTVLPASQLTVSGNAVKIKVQAYSSTYDLQITSMSIVERDSNGNGVTTPTQLYFNGSASKVIPNGGYAWTDWLTFAIDESKSYLVHFSLLQTVNNYYPYLSGMQDGAHYYKNTTDDDALVQNISGYASGTYLIAVAEVDVTSQITPVKFKLQATMTPGKAGPISARIFLGIPGASIYIDPKISES